MSKTLRKNIMDTTKDITRYEIQHIITGEIKYFNHARRALRFMLKPENIGQWEIPILEIRMTQVLEQIY